MKSDPDHGAGICTLEQHVTGAVAIAMYQYWLCTKDENYLREVYPILSGIADFWYKLLQTIDHLCH